MPFARTAFAALLALSPVAALAQDMQFTFTNATSLIVTQFFASPADVGDWEQDILGVDVLSPGEGVSITIADGRTQCIYDFKTVFDDGQELTETINICELGSYTVHQ